MEATLSFQCDGNFFECECLLHIGDVAFVDLENARHRLRKERTQKRVVRQADGAVRCVALRYVAFRFGAGAGVGVARVCVYYAESIA